MNMHFRSFIVLMVIVMIATTAGCDTTSTNEDEQHAARNNQTEQTDSTLSALNKQIAEDPNNYAHYVARARYYGEHQLYAEAFKDLDRAMQIDSTRSDIYLYRGTLHWNKQQIAEAYQQYLTCIQFDSTNTDCLLKAAGVDIASRNYDRALLRINNALRVNQYLPEAYYLKGRMYKDMGDTTLAKSSYTTAIEVDPNYYDAYIELGLLYAAMRSDLASEYFTSAIALKPASAEAWYNKAKYLQDTGTKNQKRYFEAFMCYDSLLRIDKQFAPAHFNKGYIWLEYLHNYDSAAFYFTKAIVVKSDYVQAYFNRGLCHESTERYNDAYQDYSTALSYEPQYTEAAVGKGRVERLRK
ncbi:MAG: tetratricopeptide repeat protein [Flavobacteriales bacterium]